MLNNTHLVGIVMTFLLVGTVTTPIVANAQMSMDHSGISMKKDGAKKDTKPSSAKTDDGSMSMKDTMKKEEKKSKIMSKPKASGKAISNYMFASKTATSSQDPGVGHESHQLAIVLPPSDKVYHGILTYSASENVQLVSLTGPLKAGDDKGQPTWTPDGKTKFALTLVDPANSAGNWQFSGNALAIHTKNKDPFTVSYSIAYRESSRTDLVATNTITSVKDPGVGHESHQLAIVLPPSDKVYHGILTYSASENVQLVSLTGPLKAGDDKGQPTWTPDGKTKFALTLVDPANSAGAWKFAGNAIAIHTKNTNPFTASYSLVAAN